MPGRKAVMTIYESMDGYSGRDHWVEKERVVLSDYKTEVLQHRACFPCETSLTEIMYQLISPLTILKFS